MFRQAEDACWGPVIDRIASALRTRAGADSRIERVRIDVTPGELFDRLARCEASIVRAEDPAERDHAGSELLALTGVKDHLLAQSPDLRGQLLAVASEFLMLHEAAWAAEVSARAPDNGDVCEALLARAAKTLSQVSGERTLLRRKIDRLLLRQSD